MSASAKPLEVPALYDDGVQVLALMGMPASQLCKFYVDHKCDKKHDCTYVHAVEAHTSAKTDAAVCRWHMSGTCHRADHCTFKHIRGLISKMPPAVRLSGGAKLTGSEANGFASCAKPSNEPVRRSRSKKHRTKPVSSRGGRGHVESDEKSDSKTPAVVQGGDTACRGNAVSQSGHHLQSAALSRVAVPKRTISQMCENCDGTGEVPFDSDDGLAPDTDECPGECKGEKRVWIEI